MGSFQNIRPEPDDVPELVGNYSLRPKILTGNTNDLIRIVSAVFGDKGCNFKRNRALCLWKSQTVK